MIKVINIDKQPANALDLLFLHAYLSKIKIIEKDQNIRAVILTSSNKSIFSSGLDLRQLVRHNNHYRRDIVTAVLLVRQIVKLILNSDKIYAAALSGAVIGSAVSIVMACDFRFASESTWFWLPDPQYGGLLADGGIDLIESACGMSEAKKICMTNKRFNIDYISKTGLADKVTSQTDIRSYAYSAVEDIINNSIITIRNTKKIINKRILKPFPLIKLLRVVNSKEMKEQLNKYKLHEK